jgi:hypothetical protein
VKGGGPLNGKDDLFMKYLHKALCVWLCAALLFGALAFAASAEEPVFDVEGDFRYRFYSDHAQAELYVGTGGAAVIPEYVRGLPVTSLSSIAFFPNGGQNNGDKVTSISIPRYVVIGGIYYSDGMFDGCVSVTEYIVDPLNENYCAVDGVLYNKDKTRLLAYPPASLTVTYTVPDGVRIESGTDFGNVEELTIGNNVTRVPALGGKLRKITLPASFTFASSAGVTFNNCDSLEEIVVHPDNPDYTVQDGILFSKDMTRAIRCPQQLNIGDYALPDSVTDVGYAFRGCTGLTGLNAGAGNQAYASQDGVLFNKGKIRLICYPAGRLGSSYTVPNDVTALEHYAFAYNVNLTSATFPEGLASVGSGVFIGCTGLTLYGYYYTPLRTSSKPIGVSFVALDQPRIDSITITPADTLTVGVGQTVQFSVTVEGYNLRDETRRVTWYILASGGAQYPSTISTNGLFRVSPNEFNQLLQVGAYSTYDGTKRASTNVIVTWPPANKTALIAKITEADVKVNDPQYTEESRAALQTVLTNAKTVRDNPNPPQILVDSTAYVLTNAINNLVEIVTKTSLVAIITEAESKVNDPQYTEASRASLQAVINSAKAVYDDGAASQAMVNDATATLSNAINVLKNIIVKEYFTLWGKTTGWEKTPLNWILLVLGFGWLWMAF